MSTEHHYSVALTWTGNTGRGTNGYAAYRRDYDLGAEGKPVISGSSDPAFHGDASRYNPEELLVASLSSCHMLWYLHLCAVAGVVIVSYSDHAEGRMIESGDGGGRFTEVTLYPVVVVAGEDMIETAMSLHKEANAKCFIANSCNFPVRHEAQCHISPAAVFTSG